MKFASKYDLFSCRKRSQNEIKSIKFIHKTTRQWNTSKVYQYINRLTIGSSTADGPTSALRRWLHQIWWSHISCTTVGRLMRWWRDRCVKSTLLAWHFLSVQKFQNFKNLCPDKIGWDDLIWTQPMKYDDKTMVTWRISCQGIIVPPPYVCGRGYKISDVFIQA